MKRREMILRTGAAAPGLNLPGNPNKFKAGASHFLATFH